MKADKSSRLSQLLQHARDGDHLAVERLFPLLYNEFHKIASHYLRREKAAHTLQPTALVHEAYMKLLDQTRVAWQGRTHFIAIGAQAMRRVLVDHARRRGRVKRGGRRLRVELDEHVAISPERDEDVLALDEALEKLATVDARQATIVELRFFGGLNVGEVAEVLSLSKRTIESEWTMARAWLRRELTRDSSDAG